MGDNWCAMCVYLAECHTVTEHMLANRQSCQLFQFAEQGTLEARADIIKECGARALRYEIPRQKQLSVKPKTRRRRNHV